jgi:uncharacterized membrane protein required for colicin V production
MTVLDWVLIVVWVGLSLAGFWKGAVRLIFGGGGLLAGLWLAVIAGDSAEAAVSGVVGAGWIAAVLARVLLVVLCAGLSLLAGWGIEQTMTAMKLGWLNRLFGACLAAVIAGVLLGFLVVVAIQMSPELADLCRESQVAQYLLWLSEQLLGAVEGMEA